MMWQAHRTFPGFTNPNAPSLVTEVRVIESSFRLLHLTLTLIFKTSNPEKFKLFFLVGL